MFRSGAFVADHVTPVTDEQVQPNGVDLTLEAVYEQCDPGRIGVDGKEIGDRQHRMGDLVVKDEHDMEAIEDPERPGGGDDVYHLPPGAYVVQYAEIVSIPENHVGFIYPRSSLLRNSCMLNTAVWDAGYSGKGEGLLQVGHDIEIEAGARIAQIVLAGAEHETTYDGSYQNERL
jgi:dUTP pyrophosphatase